MNDASGRALEVGVFDSGEQLLVAHVMDLRAKFRPLYEQAKAVHAREKGHIMNEQHEQHVDLDREAVYDSAGRRITEDYIAEAVDAIERDDVTLDEDAAIYPQRGRPSLTRPGTHSPRVDLRVPQGTKVRLARCAHQTGRSESDVVRDAIDEYLARH